MRILPSFLLFMCVCVFMIGMHEYACLNGCVCAYMWRPEVDGRQHPLPFFYLVCGGKVSQSIPGLGLGNLSLFLPRLELQEDSHTHSYNIYMDSEDLNFGSLACTSTLTAELFLQPHFFLLKK